MYRSNAKYEIPDPNKINKSSNLFMSKFNNLVVLKINKNEIKK